MTTTPRDEDPASGKRKPLPRWLVAVVILTTGGVTAAAMSMTGLRGPQLAWDRANQSIESAWFGPNANAPAETPDLTGAAAPVPAAGMPAAAVPRVPVIVAGAPMTHADRGVCSNCHSVVTQQGTPVPAIQSLATMTHEYRGVCANCHQMTLAALPNAGNPVAAIQVPSGPAAAAKTRAPTEAEWQGLEVGPSAQGVLVNGAEGTAQRAGMQAGDVVTSINALPTRSLADFVKITNNGALAQGTVIVRRSGQRFAFELGAASPAASPAANPAPSPAANPAPSPAANPVQPVGATWGGAPALPPKPEAQF